MFQEESTMFTQQKNTINVGDAFKDAFTCLLSKRVSLSDAEWLGSVESDRSEQGYDLRLSPQAFKGMFGRSGGFGSPRVRLHFGWSSFAYIKGGADFESRMAHASQGFDFLCHVRKDKSGRYLGLVMPISSAQTFIERFAREKRSAKNGYFLQFDGYDLSVNGKPAQKWQDFITSNGGWIVDLTDIGFLAEDKLESVNAKGRKDSQADTSNPLNSKRKVGLPYGER